MKRTTLILALALAVSGCSQWTDLIHRPSQSGSSATLQGIACGPARQIITEGIPMGWEFYVVPIFSTGQLVNLCKSIEDGGQARRNFVPNTRPSEAEQAQRIVPGQRVTVIGESVTVPWSVNNASASPRLSESAPVTGTRTTIMARSIRLGARRYQ